MAEEVVKVIKIQAEDSERTVKSLKKEISDLRDALLNLDKSSEEYDKALDKLIDDEKELTSVMRAGKNVMKAAEGSYNALQNEMTALRKVWKETNDEAKRNEIGARIREINNQLKEYDASIGNNQRKVGSYEEALKTLNTHFASQRQELSALKSAMDNLDPSTEAYAKAFQRAAEITHNLQERQQQLKYSTADVGDQLSNIRGIAANMAAGFSAVNAAMGLFGEKNEDVAKAMLKVQQLMAIVQGLEGMDGLIKRTRGLSDAMKVWLKGTKETTVALKAETVATKTQTVATEGATVAQKGLNTAMKANPIGLIIAAVTLLVTLFGGWIKKTFELIKGNEKLNKVLINIKSVITGVANVIKKSLLVPVKELINYIETLVKTIVKITKGDFTGAWEELKEGVNDAVTIVKEGYDVLGNYQEAYNKKSEELTRQHNEKIAKENAKARAKELEGVIADNDAKYDSDWKYTEEGQRIYGEYFDALMTMYDKDSDEYKKAQRDKWSYERDLNAKREQDEKERQKKEEERRKAAAKAAQDAQKQLKQQYESYLATINKNNASGGYSDWLKNFKEALVTYVEGLEYMKKKTKDANISEILSTQIDNATRKLKNLPDDVQALWQDLDKLLMTSSGNELGPILEELFPGKGYEKLLKDRSSDYVKVFYDNFTIELMQQGKLEETVFDAGTKLQLMRIRRTFDAALQESDSNLELIAQNMNDRVIKMFENKLFPTVEKKVQELQRNLDEQTLNLDFEINYGKGDTESLETEKVELQFQSITEQLKLQKEAYQEVVDYVEKNGLIPSEEYEKAKSKIEEINDAIGKATNDRFMSLNAIRKRYFSQEITDTQAHYDELSKIMTNSFDRENNTGNWWKMIRPIDPKEEKKQLDELYTVEMEGLNKIKELWQNRLADGTLSNEDRIEAEQQLAQAEMDIADKVLQHDMEVSEKKAEIWENTVNFAMDAVSEIGSLFGSLADVYQADIDAQVQAGKMSEKEADKHYKRIQSMQIAETVLNTIAGSIGAFLQASKTYPSPWGQIIGGVAAASVAAAGAASIAKLKSQNKNSSSSVAVEAPTTEVIPQYVSTLSNQSDTDYLRNAVVDGMASTQLFVSVTDIDNVQNKVRTTQKESTF